MGSVLKEGALSSVSFARCLWLFVGRRVSAHSCNRLGHACQDGGTPVARPKLTRMGPLLSCIPCERLCSRYPQPRSLKLKFTVC